MRFFIIIAFLHLFIYVFEMLKIHALCIVSQDCKTEIYIFSYLALNWFIKTHFITIASQTFAKNEKIKYDEKCR